MWLGTELVQEAGKSLPSSAVLSCYIAVSYEIIPKIKLLLLRAWLVPMLQESWLIFFITLLDDVRSGFHFANIGVSVCALSESVCVCA